MEQDRQVADVLDGAVVAPARGEARGRRRVHDVVVRRIDGQARGLRLVRGVRGEERAPGAGRAFLNELGDPFSRIVTDPHGAAGINWGVYGVPETYVVDGKGIVRFKLVGGLTADALTQQLLPEIEKARQAS